MQAAMITDDGDQLFDDFTERFAELDEPFSF